MLAYKIKPGRDSIEQTELTRPSTSPGEVVLKVSAVSLNCRDLLEARGSYSATSGSFGIVPTSDEAGEVIEVGKGVERFKIGDRVVAGELSKERQASALGRGQVNGTLAQEVFLPASALLPVLSHLSYEEAATLPCAGIAAWYALFEGAYVVPGKQK
jgi:NADPH:quinone reductase-like Zn-dependent oxidoreductase